MNTWEERLEDLAAINYNLYFGSPAERADKINEEGDRIEWSYEEALNEIKSFIRSQIEQAKKEEKERIFNMLDDDIKNHLYKTEAIIGQQEASQKVWRDNGGEGRGIEKGEEGKDGQPDYNFSQK